MSPAGHWSIECDLKDGARIRRLRYGTVDLLTTAPPSFRAPAADYGRYETRPVFGYDDCFPTVDVCDNWPDHGELCWLPWHGTETDCSVSSQRWPATFRRRLDFDAHSLRWCFAIMNHGSIPLAFQHVMHPLMPLDQIAHVDLPVALREIPRGRSAMFFIPQAGQFALTFCEGLRLEVRYDAKLFPTLGIWWNNHGYPDEDGLRRCECAFEPTPGPSSRLSDGTTMTVAPGATLNWQIEWTVR